MFRIRIMGNMKKNNQKNKQPFQPVIIDEYSVKIIHNLLKSDSEIIRFYSIWAIWKITKFIDIEKFYDVDLEESELVKNEYLRLMK